MIVYRELSSLVRDLGIPAGTLYAVSNTLDRHYIRRQLPKSSGGVRELSVPDPLCPPTPRPIDTAAAPCAMLRPMWESPVF